MSLKCAIMKCKSKAVNKERKKISFFKFPLTIPPLLEQWIRATNRKNWTPTASSRICELHFNDDDFSNTVKVRRLKVDVVPSKNLVNESFIEDPCKYINGCVQDVLLQMGFIERNDSRPQNKTENQELRNCDPNEHNLNTEELIIKEENITADIDTWEVIQPTDTVPKFCETGQAEKRVSTDPLEIMHRKCSKLEKENERLKALINSLREDHENQLKSQADTFKIVVEKEKELLKQKLLLQRKKSKLLHKQKNRKDIKIQNLLHQLKTK